MILPRIDKRATPAQVGKTFIRAAVELELAGRAALEAAAPESTALLLGGAVALRDAGDALLARGRSKSREDSLLYNQARRALEDLAGALPTASAMNGGYARDLLRSYWVVLERCTRGAPGEHRWPRSIRPPRSRRSSATASSNPTVSVRDDGGPRRYLIEEVTCWPGYIGSIWAVGCTTIEAAKACFDRRVLRNLAEEHAVGNVFAYDRHTADVIAWSSGLAKGWTAGRVNLRASLGNSDTAR